MAYMIIKVEADNVTINDMNAKLKDNTNPDEGMNQLEDLINAVNGRNISATVTVVVRDTDQTITAQGGGGTSTYDKR